MRTLKKSLALVLALVMVLGLGVVGASADNKLDSYTDAGEIGDAYVEAVGVLTGLGIVDGRTDTEIVPEATYNRAEAAKIIAYMLLGKDQADALKATVAPFEDVSVDFWAAGYIAYCAELGIISGMTETTFEPYGTLTGYQWAKMLLVAVGYGKNGEFEGDSWSLNTATVVAKTGLNEGDLEAADHVALRREQAMLFAFNALNLRQVTYSPNSTNYVYDIWGYVFADGTGTTLGEEVYDLAKVEGQIIDNEGMGNANTIVKTTGRWAHEVTIDANTGLDVMFHAVRVWYTEGKTNTAVYVNDLAVVETTTCPFDLPATYTVIGEKGEIYRVDEVDNEAVDGVADINVAFKADWGTYRYADVAEDLTYVTSNTGETDTTIDSDFVKTDVSEYPYGTTVVYLLTDSEKDATDEALYMQPVTTTTGVVASFTRSSDGQFTVVLDDGTEIKESVFYDGAAAAGLVDAEFYRPGNVFTFVLDTHGDVIYATRANARDLYAYTGEWKATGEFNDINTEIGREFRFVNVSSGESVWASAYFTNDDDDSLWQRGYRPQRGDYFDLSAGTNADGQHRAELITNADDTYADGYYVDDLTFVLNDTQDEFQVTVGGERIFFDADTVTFLVATGDGDDFTVKSYTGVNALKTDYNVSNNGFIRLTHTALTIDETVTGDWNASVVFVLAEDVTTMTDYVFIPADIDMDDWTTVNGFVDQYTVTYSGAYLNGKEFSVVVDARQLWGGTWRNNTLERGFYSVRVDYDRNGTPTYTLIERVDNVQGTCYYQDVGFAATSNVENSVWYLEGTDGRDYRVDANTLVVDVTNPNHALSGTGASAMSNVYYAMEYAHKDYSLAFTVDRVTGNVDVVYVVEAGWDAKVTISLSQDLIDAGWKVVKVADKEFNGTNAFTSKDFNDLDAEALVNPGLNVVLYNANLAGKTTQSTEYTYWVNTEDATGKSKLNDGTISVVLDVDDMVLGTKTRSFTIGGLEIGTVKVEGTDRIVTATPNKNLVLGEAVKVTVQKNPVDVWTVIEAGDVCQNKWHYDFTCILEHSGINHDYTITNGELSRDAHSVEFTFYPFHINETYTIANADWVHSTDYAS